MHHILFEIKEYIFFFLHAYFFGALKLSFVFFLLLRNNCLHFYSPFTFATSFYCPCNCSFQRSKTSNKSFVLLFFIAYPKQLQTILPFLLHFIMPHTNPCSVQSARIWAGYLIASLHFVMEPLHSY